MHLEKNIELYLNKYKYDPLLKMYNLKYGFIRNYNIVNFDTRYSSAADRSNKNKLFSYNRVD